MEVGRGGGKEVRITSRSKAASNRIVHGSGSVGGHNIMTEFTVDFIVFGSAIF